MKKLDEMTLMVKNSKKCKISVAQAADEEVLLAVVQARKEGLAEAILTGNASLIETLLVQLGENKEDYEILNSNSDEESAQLAVERVRNKEANCLMKGLLPTPTLMRAVLNKENGLRTGRILSHVMAYEVSTYPKLLFLTDGGLNPAPTLEHKQVILENAATALLNMDYGSINAACICGSEKVDPKIVATEDAQSLASMKDHWKNWNMNVFGPVGLDLAISEQSCRHKGYSEPGAGDADILLVPTYEVGNGIGKAMSYFAAAKNAGIIVGAAAPIVLVSRSDSSESKKTSIAMAILASGNR